MACKSSLLFQSSNVVHSLPKPTIINQIKEAFRKRFGLVKASNDIHIHWLFEYCSKLITEKRWVYASVREPIDVLEQHPSSQLFVNCFDLADLLIDMTKELGLPAHLAERTEYIQRMSKRLSEKHKDVFGKFECFDARQKGHFLSEGNVFFFDKHCVAKINNHYYDLTFLCHYKNEFDIFDTSIKAQIFHFAARNNFEEVRKLIQENPQFNINSQAPDGETLLHIASRNENLEMVKFLLEKKIDANIANKRKELPIHYHTDYSSPIFELLEEYTDKKIVLDLVNANPRHVFDAAVTAIQNDNLGYLVKIFSQWNFDVNHLDTYTSSEGYTLLHWAASYQKLGAAKILRIYKADANIKTTSGDIPLKFVHPPNEELFNFLAKFTKESEIKVAKEMYDGLARYYDKLFEASIAIQDNNLAKLKRMINNEIINVNAQDGIGNTLLHWAAFYNKIEIARYLLSVGAVLMENNTQAWPIHSLGPNANPELWSFLDHEPKLEQALLHTTPMASEQQEQLQLLDDYNHMNGLKIV